MAKAGMLLARRHSMLALTKRHSPTLDMLRLLRMATNFRREGFKAGQPSLERKSDIFVNVINFCVDVRL